MIAAREIRPADRPLEKHVANNRELRFGMMEYDMAGGMTGAVPDVEGELSDSDGIAIDQVAVGRERPAIDPVALAIFLKAGDPEQIFLVGAFDRHAQFLGKDSRLAAMVDVSVRNQDLLDRDSSLGGGRL